MPAPGKFPLIVYLASYNGMGYENYVLFEQWVKRGFVVVSINSIGRYPGDMTMKNDDLLEQVNDALYSINFLRSEPLINFSKIGIAGYSWGGLAGTIIAGRLKETACVLSLDGSEFHHYGASKEDDADFNEIVNSSDLSRMALSVPYLRLQSAPVGSKSSKDSVYNFLNKMVAQKQVMTIDSSTHEDFSCLPTIVRASGGCRNNGRFDKVLAMSVNYFQKHLN